MGKASSSKKVARAARAGGRRRGQQRTNLAWPLAMGVVVVLGGLLIWASRGGNDAGADVPPRVLEDHWHTAYGIWACDRWLPPIQDQSDPAGIHTHGDGVVHVHPFSARVAGENATLDAFAEAVDMRISDDRLVVPGVGSFNEDGTDCDGDQARARVLVWDDARADEQPTQTITENLADVRLFDGQAIAIVFAPAEEEIPKPPTVPVLDNLSDVPGGGAPPPQGGTTPTSAGGTSGGHGDDDDAPTTEDTGAPATTDSP